MSSVEGPGQPVPQDSGTNPPSSPQPASPKPSDPAAPRPGMAAGPYGSRPAEHYRPPSESYRRASDEFRRASDDFRRPSEDFRRPSSEFRRSSEDFQRPSGEYRRPSDEYRRPSDEYRRPSDEYRRPSDEYRRPSDEYRRTPEDARAARNEGAGGHDGFRPTPNRRPPRRTGHFSSIANSASQALHGLGGLHNVMKSLANGDRPVAVHIPPRADHRKPMDLVLFFHGKGAQLDELFGQNQLTERVREHGRNHPNTVFAFPQGHVRERYHHWMSQERNESLTRLLIEIREAAAKLMGAEKLLPGKLTIKAHSGGGVVFKNAVDANELQADRLEFFDAMYGNWGDAVAEWAKRPENAHVEFGVVYSPHQQAQVRAFRKALTGHRNMQIERARVGHSQIPHEYWHMRPPQR